ncbi:hypothetical protein [Iningainema tapete]|nr:hypothetical protein [Iningainema tapete]
MQLTEKWKADYGCIYHLRLLAMCERDGAIANPTNQVLAYHD